MRNGSYNIRIEVRKGTAELGFVYKLYKDGKEGRYDRMTWKDVPVSVRKSIKKKFGIE